ncbi:hypothetical protein KIPB_015641, partial [Kipferlia bialata]
KNSKKPPQERWLVINGDEGEPGTSKDRYIMLHDPHRLLHGTALAAKAIGSKKAAIYIRGEFKKEQEHVWTAI